MNSSSTLKYQASRRGWLRGALRLLAFLALGIVLPLGTLWAAAALSFDMPVSWLCTPLALVCLLSVLAVWILAKGRWLKMGLTAGAFALVLGW